MKGLFGSVGLMILSPLVALLQAFVLWLAWTWAETGEKFFSFLPEVWQHPGIIEWFWICLSINAFWQATKFTKIVMVPRSLWRTNK